MKHLYILLLLLISLNSSAQLADSNVVYINSEMTAPDSFQGADIRKIVDTADWGSIRYYIKVETMFLVGSPKNIPHYLQRGHYKSQIRDFEGAKADYRMVIELDSINYNGYMSLANVLDKQFRYEEAIINFNKALEIFPSSDDIYYNRGLCFANMGKYMESINDFTQAISLNPNDWMSYFSRASSQSRLGMKDSALKDYSASIAIEPKYYDSYFNRGLIRASLKDYKGAIEDFDMVLTYVPNIMNAYVERGNCKYELGDKKAACADYLEAIKHKYVDKNKMIKKRCK